MWGFYPDDVNPHRVGFVTVMWPCAYTYWVEPRWMEAYARLAGTCLCLGGACHVPGPFPPPLLVLPAGPGHPSEWDAARHVRAKVTCWQLTGNGWAVSRRWLLAHGHIEP